MRKIVLFFVGVFVLMGVSCKSRKHDAAYYEQMVDSIRKAEQVNELRQKAGMHEEPLKAFFDTLRYHTLPIRSEKSDFSSLGKMTDIPRMLNSHFGYSESDDLQAVLMPDVNGIRVFLLAEKHDGDMPELYLYTLTRNLQPIDVLCIYEQKDEDRMDDYGKSYTEFYITSSYEITLLQLYVPHEKKTPQLYQTRRYTIDKEGKFEEVIVEI